MKTVKAWAIVRDDNTFLPYDREHSVAVFASERLARDIYIGKPERIVRVEIREIRPVKRRKVSPDTTERRLLKMLKDAKRKGAKGK